MLSAHLLDAASDRQEPSTPLVACQMGLMRSMVLHAGASGLIRPQDVGGCSRLGAHMESEDSEITLRIIGDAALQQEAHHP